MSPRRATRKPPRPQLQIEVVALMRRGEVWVARLNPNQGAEVGKVRPVVVIPHEPRICRRMPCPSLVERFAAHPSRRRQTRDL